MFNLQIGFLTLLDPLIEVFRVLEDFTTKDESLPERQFKFCLVTFVVVATSVIQLATTRLGATVVGLDTGVLLSEPCGIITFSSDQHHKKRHSLSSSSKNNTLSDEMIDNNRESHFLFEQTFRGFSF